MTTDAVTLIGRYLRLLDRLSPRRRLALLLATLAVCGGVGYGAGVLVDVLIDNPKTQAVTLVVVLLGLAVLLTRSMVGSRPSLAEALAPYRPAGPNGGRAPCALCGFNCIPGGFWTPVPGFVNHVMHTMSCGPNLPGEEPLAAPTHERLPDGRYRPLG